MAIRPLSLPYESSPGRFGQDGDPRLINVYAEKRGTAERAAKQQWSHYAAPGLRAWSTVAGQVGCRGLFAVDAARMIGVIGQRIISFDAFGSQTDLGGMLGSSGVFFARNLKSPNAQIVIVGDSQNKVIEGSTLASITDPDLPPAHSCDFLNRYVLFFHSSGRFSYSDINAADSIAALSFYLAEGKPDGLVRGKVFGNQVWLFGEESVEIWGLTENVDNPFRRLEGTYIDLGCIAPHSVVQIGNRMAWIANDFTVRIAAGYETEVISTHQVSAAIAALVDKTTIEANVVTVRGQQFLRLNSSAWTWVLNLTQGYGLWHEETSIGLTRRRSSFGARFAGKYITGDTQSGALWSWDADHGVDGDSALICRVVTAPQHVYPGEVEFNALYVDGIAGSGLNTPSNAVTLDPVMMVRDSDDGGSSWSNEIQLPIGRQGQTKTRTVAHQLGTSGEDGRQFEFRWDAAANKAIVAASVDAVAVAP